MFKPISTALISDSVSSCGFKEGRLDCLEGYAIGDEALSLDLNSLIFEIVPGAKLIRLSE